MKADMSGMSMSYAVADFVTYIRFATRAPSNYVEIGV